MACNNHTPCPDGYLNWHDWAKKMSKTHMQTKCPDCSKYVVWVPKKSKQEILNTENKNMIQLIENTKKKDLRDVVFEDIDELVSSREKAWMVNTFLFRYFSTEKAATDWCQSRGISTTTVK